MGFGAAVSTVFSKYATFSGRARRSEYWWWVLFTVIVNVIASIIDRAVGWRAFGDDLYVLGWVSLLAGLVLLLPSFAVLVRRLHDTGRSGWWWLLSLVCGIGAIIVLVFTLIPSEPRGNQYGPDPSGP